MESERMTKWNHDSEIAEMEGIRGGLRMRWRDGQRCRAEKGICERRVFLLRWDRSSWRQFTYGGTVMNYWQTDKIASRYWELQQMSKSIGVGASIILSICITICVRSLCRYTSYPFTLKYFFLFTQKANAWFSDYLHFSITSGPVHMIPIKLWWLVRVRSSVLWCFHYILVATCDLWSSLSGYTVFSSHSIIPVFNSHYRDLGVSTPLWHQTYGVVLNRSFPQLLIWV